MIFKLLKPLVLSGGFKDVREVGLHLLNGICEDGYEIKSVFS